MADQILPAVRRMQGQPGLWLLKDTSTVMGPVRTLVPVVSRDGKIYAVEIGQELDPTRFLPGIVTLGPYT